MSFKEVWDAFYGDRKPSESKPRAEKVYNAARAKGHDLSGFLAHVRSLDKTGREFAATLRSYVMALDDQPARAADRPTPTPPKAKPADVQIPAPASPPVVASVVAPPVDDLQRLRALYTLWVERNPRGGFDTVLEAWGARPNDLTIEVLDERVRWRLRQYDADTDDPEKSKHLGALSNFIGKGKWRDQRNPSADVTPVDPKPSSYTIDGRTYTPADPEWSRVRYGEGGPELAPEREPTHFQANQFKLGNLCGKTDKWGSPAPAATYWDWVDCPRCLELRAAS